jgi:hypothetical protein
MPDDSPIDPSKLVFIEKPDDPVPQTKVVMPDGSEIDLSEAGLPEGDLDDDEDFRSEYEATPDPEDEDEDND